MNKYTHLLGLLLAFSLTLGYAPLASAAMSQETCDNLNAYISAGHLGYDFSSLIYRTVVSIYSVHC